MALLAGLGLALSLMEGCCGGSYWKFDLVDYSSLPCARLIFPFLVPSFGQRHWFLDGDCGVALSSGVEGIQVLGLEEDRKSGIQGDKRERKRNEMN